MWVTIIRGAGAIAAEHGNAAQALAHAVGAMQNGNFTAAVTALEQRPTALGNSVRAWRVLGLAHLKLRHTVAAQAALRRVLALAPDDPQALYYLGIAAAQLGDVESTFAWLQKARATTRFDMTQITIEKDLQSLHADPRYTALLPAPESFTHPFVEDVRILREWDGEAAGDQFGWIARVLGDVDGDGASDFVTSAPTKNIHGENAGRVYVYSQRSGALLWSADGAPGDQLGTGVESAGDTNGDGIADVIASAPFIGTAYVYSGRDGRVLLTMRGEAKGDNFGQHVASAGDIDGDGYADIIVGAPNNSAGGKDAGRAYVYSGKDGHLLVTLTGEGPGALFGSTVAGSGDARHCLLVVGAPGAGPRKTGRVYVYAGRSARPKFTFDADASGVALGYMFVSLLGDVDGDGFPDVFAADWSDAARGPGTGKVYVYSGRTGRRLRVYSGATTGEGFGTTHSVAGDINGDGRADLIVGSWQYSVAAQSGGRAYLYDGRSGRLLRTYTSRIAGDTFGFDAVGMHAADNAGQAGLLITAGWSAVRGFHSGRVFLIATGVPDGHETPRRRPEH